MSRLTFAAALLAPLGLRSVLDVGCRDAALADDLPGVDYAGADLAADPRGRVKYVGDITRMAIDRTFDAVVALDILEHLERPSELFDRLVPLADRYLLISFPNTYDLKSRFKFAVRGQLGGKYVFSDQHSEDRHRWLMNRDEILAFFAAKAGKHRLKLQVHDLKYGALKNRGRRALGGRLLSRLLPSRLTSATVFALFEK